MIIALSRAFDWHGGGNGNVFILAVSVGRSGRETKLSTMRIHSRISVFTCALLVLSLVACGQQSGAVGDITMEGRVTTATSAEGANQDGVDNETLQPLGLAVQPQWTSDDERSRIVNAECARYAGAGCGNGYLERRIGPSTY